MVDYEQESPLLKPVVPIPRDIDLLGQLETILNITAVV